MQETCDDQLDRRWLLTGNLPCLGCEYNLRGLVGPVVRCPECARENDLRRASLWRSQQLPLGVTERGHWPATAVVWSMFTALAVAFLIAMLRSGGDATLYAAIAVFVTAGGWAITARQWIQSCQRTGWAVGMFVVIHLSFWAIPGAALLWAATENLLVLLLCPAGAAGVLWAEKELKRAEGTPAYRTDWRNWRLPTGGDADGEGRR